MALFKEALKVGLFNGPGDVALIKAFDDAAAPSRRFLPGTEYMRGGAAQHFASDTHFHRGIQAESTCRVISKKETHYQWFAESRLG